MTSRWMTRVLAALFLASALPLTSVSAKPVKGQVRKNILVSGGLTRIIGSAPAGTGGPLLRHPFTFSPGSGLPDFYQRIPQNGRFGSPNSTPRRNAHSLRSTLEVPAPNDFSSVNGPGPGFFGFDGLTHFDQRYALFNGTPNTQFSLEPPDQGLAVGNGYVLENVNNALSVYTTAGALVAGPTPMNQFFKLGAEIYRPSGPFGASLSDIRAYYDAPTQRWFVEEWGQAVDPATGSTLSASFIGLAVSQTSDPTGVYNLYFLSTTNTAVSGVPSYPDYTYVGADTNGIYLSSNMFSIADGSFQGANIFVLPKAAVEAGLPTASIPVGLFNGLTSSDGEVAFCIAPSRTPPGAVDSTAAGGTEYLLSSFVLLPDASDFRPSDNRLDVWAITGTGTLNSDTPNLTLSDSIIGTEVYYQPVPADQKSGSTPLRDAIAQPNNAFGVPAYNNPLDSLDPDDDRLFQVMYSQGLIWSSTHTEYTDLSGNQRDAVAYFVVRPTTSTTGVVSATVKNQGYVAVNGANLIYPSLGVNASGKGAIGFTLSGQKFFPSAAYVTFDGRTVGPGGSLLLLSNVRTAGRGRLPDDGFTGYQQFGPRAIGLARWGDYSAAVTDENGAIWLADEYVPNNTGILTGAHPRSSLANWGTFVSKIQP